MENNSDNIENYVVVIKPNQKFEIFSDLKNSYKDIFYTNNDTFYSILTKFTHTIKFNLTKQYKIYQPDCLISKIILDDFPINQQYIMRGCGANLATAQVINNKPIFNIDNEKPSNMLSGIINASITENDKNIDDRNKYLNISKIDDFGFLTNKYLENNYNVKLLGLYYKDNVWIKDVKNYSIYPYETCLNYLRDITSSLWFTCNWGFKISLKLNGLIYGPFTSKFDNKYKMHSIKFNFDGWNDIIDGKQNKYVSDEINKKSINLSQIENISVILIDGEKEIYLYQYAYKIYYIDGCFEMFA